jgi:hypothetical protein
MIALTRAAWLVAIATVQISAAAAGSADDDRPVRLPPVKSCENFSNITSAEFHGIKNLNQLIQSKSRRASELNSFIAYKTAPSNDTAQRAMWETTRWALSQGLERQISAQLQRHGSCRSVVPHRSHGYCQSSAGI